MKLFLTISHTGDGPQFRDLCIELGIVQPLLKFVAPADEIRMNILRTVTWVSCEFYGRKMNLISKVGNFP
jgi:hypothetical protein